MIKAEFRKLVRNRISSMSSIQRRDLSIHILEKLEEEDVFKAAKTVMMYYSLPDEVQTHLFVDKWSKVKNILLPEVHGQNLDLKLYHSQNEMCESPFHISVPIGVPYVDISSIDLIVVPGVAFDWKGHRLGRGRGFYDRFLSQEELQNVCKIGIAYPCQVFDEIPVESHDIPMDKILS